LARMPLAMGDSRVECEFNLKLRSISGVLHLENVVC
jgi:hypothetical protein